MKIPASKVGIFCTRIDPCKFRASATPDRKPKNLKAAKARFTPQQEANALATRFGKMILRC
jgi:hypothetical protein